MAAIQTVKRKNTMGLKDAIIAEELVCETQEKAIREYFDNIFLPAIKSANEELKSVGKQIIILFGHTDFCEFSFWLYMQDANGDFVQSDKASVTLEFSEQGALKRTLRVTSPYGSDAPTDQFYKDDTAVIIRRESISMYRFMRRAFGKRITDE